MAELVTVRETGGDLFGSSWAEFDPARERRYVLGRRWSAGPTCVFGMLNPSVADALRNDPTVVRCCGFARREGCGAMVIVNLFTIRATDPAALYRHPDPIGPGADEVIRKYCTPGTLVIAAWGVHGRLLDRGNQVRALLADAGVSPACFGATRAGEPRHPLYLPSNTPLMPLPTGGPA